MASEIYGKNGILFFLVYLTACIVVLKNSFLELKLDSIYYLVSIISLLYLFFYSKNIIINKWIISFILIAFLSIVLNKIPAFFRPTERLLAFTLLILLVSPAINSRNFNIFKIRLWSAINKLIMIMVVLSFLGIIIGLPQMNGRGGITGLFNHSMLLGPMAAISMLNSLYNFEKAKKISRYYYGILAFSAFVVCIAAGSRGALLALIVGVLVFYYLKNGNRILKYLRTITIIVILVLATFPFWQPFTERIMSKMEYSQSQGELIVTRSSLWEMRFKEFLKSPVYGIGFSAVDVKTSDRFDKITGVIEPGSSWLIVFSMTGLIGGCTLVFMLRSYVKFVFENASFEKSLSLNGGILFFFIVHFFFEGYLFASGSGLFFYFWLLLGVISIQKSLLIES